MAGKLLLDAAGQAINTSLQQLQTAITNQSTNLNTIGTALETISTDAKSDINKLVTRALQNTNDIRYLRDIYAVLDDLATAENGAGLHNSLYRGKNLGTEPTAADYANIANGTFKNLWVGDYWEKTVTVSGTNYNVKQYVADCNYRLNTGNTKLTTNHILTVPHNNYYNSKYRSPDSSQPAGYYNAYIKQTGLNRALEIVNAFFGENHILQHRNYLTNAISDGFISGVSWYDTKIDLMNQAMITGNHYQETMTKDNKLVSHLSIDKTQLAIFRLNSTLCSSNSQYVIRDLAYGIISTAPTTVIYPMVYDGIIGGTYAYPYDLGNFGVRPACLIA